MTINFHWQAVTPLVMSPDGSVAKVAECKLVLATEQEFSDLETYVGTSVAVFDLARCVTAVYDGIRFGVKVEVHKSETPP